MGGTEGQNPWLFKRFFIMNIKIKWLSRNKMNSYGSSRIGRGTLIVALKCLRDLLKYVIYNKILKFDKSDLFFNVMCSARPQS